MSAARKAGLEIGIALNVGRQRRHKINQDSLDIVLPRRFRKKPPLFIVADGMGGHKGGKIASQIVVDEMKRVYQRTKVNGDPLDLLKKCILEAHRVIIKRGKADPSLASMGSTVAACIIDKDMYFFSNVGDTRGYLSSGNKLQQISYDHSWVAEQYRQGK